MNEARIKELTKKYCLQIVNGNICSLKAQKMTDSEIQFLSDNKKDAIKIIISENAKNPGIGVVAAVIINAQVAFELEKNNRDLTEIINKFAV